MSLPIEKWARQAYQREQLGDLLEPVASRRIAYDVAALAELHLQTWQLRQAAIIASGQPYNMPEGLYAAVGAIPNVQTVTTTSLSGTVNLWSNLVYTPIPINSMMAPQIYRIMVCAKITTSTSPANIGFNPLINSVGTWTTGGTAVSGGNTMGASGNIALTASITNAFYLIIGDMTIRASGTTGSCVGMFHYISTQGTSSGLAGPAAIGTGHNLLFGGTTVTPDFQTTGQSFQLGAVHTVTTITHNIEQIHFCDWN